MAALVLIACIGVDTDPAGDADPVDPAIERFVESRMPDGASGTMAVAHDGELVHCDGFGLANRAEGIPAGCDTVYDIQSLTKQFTATAILVLESMGRLQVSDPIGDYLGPVPADKRDITIHHLLTHTAGFRDSLGGDYEPLSREQLVVGALASRLRSAPGTEYRYSNLGYGLLAAIVETASGVGYEEFLAEHLFEPAGMAETGYVLPEWDEDLVAVEYDRQGRSRGRPFERSWASDGPYWNLRGNGGLLTTARDMLRWHMALESDTILDRRTKERLFTPYVRDAEGAGTHYGYGWFVEESPQGLLTWHDGGNAWNLSMLTRAPEQDAMVFWVTNAYRDRARGWNLERLEPALTDGILERIERRD